MKFKLRDKVICRGNMVDLEGTVIEVLYHKVKVELKGFGKFMLKKKDVDLKT